MIRFERMKAKILYTMVALSSIALAGCNQEALAEKQTKEENYVQFEEVNKIKVEYMKYGSEVVGSLVRDKQTGCLYVMDGNATYVYSFSPLYDENGKIAGCKGLETNAESEGEE